MAGAAHAEFAAGGAGASAVAPRPDAQQRWRLVHPGNWLAWLATAFAAGLAASYWSLWLWLVLPLFGALALVWRRPKLRPYVLVAGLFVAVGLLLNADRPIPLPPTSGPLEASIWAVEPASPTTKGCRVIVQAADGERLLAYFRLVPQQVPAGVRLATTGTAKPIPADWPIGYRNWLERREVYRVLFVQTAEPQVAAEGQQAWIARVRHRAALVLDSVLHGGERAALGRALVLGDRSHLARDTRDAFAITGTLHLVAVSGSHLSLLLVLVLAAITPLGGNLYVYRRWQAPLLLLLLLGYALLTGFEPPVVRALLMAAFLLLGRILNRQATGWNLWGAALLVQLAASPTAIADASVQLSYVAVAGLLFWLPRLFPLLPGGWSGLPLQVLAATAAAQLALLPLQLMLFEQLPVYVLPANLLLQPFAALALLLGVLAVPLSVMPGLNILCAALLAGCLDLMLAIADGFARLPVASVPVAATPTPIGVVLLVLALTIYASLRWLPVPRRVMQWV